MVLLVLISVGFLVGLLVGLLVGRSAGLTTGLLFGLLVGLSVGLLVGCSTGLRVGTVETSFPDSMSKASNVFVRPLSSKNFLIKESTSLSVAGTSIGAGFRAADKIPGCPVVC